MRNGLISVDAYKKSSAFYIYERKLRYCIEVFFRVRKRASGNASMEKVLCVSVLVKFPRAETRAFLPQWKAALSPAFHCGRNARVSARGNFTSTETHRTFSIEAFPLARFRTGGKKLRYNIGVSARKCKTRAIFCKHHLIM